MSECIWSLAGGQWKTEGIWQQTGFGPLRIALKPARGCIVHRVVLVRVLAKQRRGGAVPCLTQHVDDVWVFGRSHVARRPIRRLYTTTILCVLAPTIHSWLVTKVVAVRACSCMVVQHGCKDKNVSPDTLLCHDADRMGDGWPPGVASE